MAAFALLAIAAAALLFACAPRTAFAADVDAWDGTTDTAWYTENPDADTFVLDSAEDLAGLAELTNQADRVTFTGKTVQLAVDVDLAGHTWTAISESGANSTSSSFSGTFDGQGHTVYNLNIVDVSENRCGLFGTVFEATVRNLGVDGALVVESADSGYLTAGLVVAWAASSTVENCWATGSFTSHSGYLLGGVVGQGTGPAKVVGCWSDVDITCTSNTAAPTVGGVVGQYESTTGESLISGCYFSGSITCNSMTSAFGGILGACVDYREESKYENNPEGYPTLTMSNCLVTTTDFNHPVYATYLGIVPPHATIDSCYWPAVYDNGTGMELFVFPLGILMDDKGSVGFYTDDEEVFPNAGGDYSEIRCAEVADFTDPALLAALNESAIDGVSWTVGMDGTPVLSWQANRIAADYGGVDFAVAQAEGIDRAGYTDASLAALDAAIAAVNRSLSQVDQDKVDEMAAAIMTAIANLEKKPYIPPTPPARPTYPPTVDEGGGGSVAVTPSRPHSGEDVTVEPTPDEGQEVRDVTVVDRNGDEVAVVDNGDGTWSFTQPAGSVTVRVEFGCDGGALCPSAGFTDVDQSQWYHDPIDWAVSNGVLHGIGGTALMQPDEPITRAQMAAVLFNVEGADAGSAQAMEDYADADPNAWYVGSLAWAVEQGLFYGWDADGASYIDPDGALTREQAAAVLMRWTERRGADVTARADLTAFPDADGVSDWATECMQWAVAEGVLQGVEQDDGERTLEAQGTATRAQAAALMMRLTAEG